MYNLVESRTCCGVDTGHLCLSGVLGWRDKGQLASILLERESTVSVGSNGREPTRVAQIKVKRGRA